MTVADIARVATLSPFHLHRMFKEAFGMTPMRMLQNHRLQVARKLLGRGTPVTLVASAVGFESLGSFGTLFRRTFGEPPGRLRKKQD